MKNTRVLVNDRVKLKPGNFPFPSGKNYPVIGSPYECIGTVIDTYSETIRGNKKFVCYVKWDNERFTYLYSDDLLVVKHNIDTTGPNFNFKIRKHKGQG